MLLSVTKKRRKEYHNSGAPFGPTDGNKALLAKVTEQRRHITALEDKAKKLLTKFLPLKAELKQLKSEI